MSTSRRVNGLSTGDLEETDQVSMEPPKRHAPTHNVPVCNLHFRSYLPSQLDFFVDFAQRAAYALHMPCSGPVYLPTQRSQWTVIKSPFIHKKSQENFERKTHKRLLQIKDAHPETVQRWLHYLRMNAPAGIGLKATLWEYEAMGVGQHVDAVKMTKRSGSFTPEEVKQEADRLIKHMDAEST
ncbi:hypothetical protein BZG36_03897 [Bifiguratus adelaidae]|uniref:Small ribosomal subunit protein uS10m n=1 Tax=Bifiguratus adelaidae TaxID=1938954 RepID=A0A261XXS2_9FUNG|nr:hypothetical protein BZG36_03897 [Bifiguratus adelaidae]